MSFLNRIFGKSKNKTNYPKPAVKPTADPANDPNMIRVYDKFGQEMFITRQDWRDNVLIGNIKNAWNNPDELYNLIVQSLQDEFYEEIVDACVQLHKIDPVPSRGATVLGIVYMKTGRLDDAENILKNFMAKHGEEGVVLTNLAKVYAEREQHELSEQTLLHALELDPNQDSGLLWYEAILRERDGEEASLNGLQRIAEVPGSWRAQLWLARSSLESKNLDQAIELYKEALLRGGTPVPTDLLQQMSGDLGNNGYLKEIIELAGPCFDTATHGLLVGNNLIKAHLDLGELDAAQAILDELYSLKRPDWRDCLSYWDTELAKARIEGRQPTPNPVGLTMLSIEGPIWMRGESPFASLLTPKASDAPVIGIMGSTAILANSPHEPVAQLADGPGRLSRALPLLMSEKLHLATNVATHALLPWAQGNGFALMGKPYADKDLCELAAKQVKPMDYIAYITLNTALEPWNAEARLLRISDGEVLGDVTATIDTIYPGNGVEQLLLDFHKLVIKEPNVKSEKEPKWYCVPDGTDKSDYLLRLEQQLAVVCMNFDFLKGGGLSGEREIIDGAMQLCVRQPKNKTIRMLFIQTLRQMKLARPDILHEFKEKVDLLMNDYPLPGEVGKIAAPAIMEVFTD